MLAKAVARVPELAPSASSQGPDLEQGLKNSSEHSPSASGQGPGHSPGLATSSDHSPSPWSAGQPSQARRAVVLAGVGGGGDGGLSVRTA